MGWDGMELIWEMGWGGIEILIQPLVSAKSDPTPPFLSFMTRSFGYNRFVASTRLHTGTDHPRTYNNPVLRRG